VEEKSLENHGKTWKIMGKSWEIMENHGKSMGKPWKIIKYISKYRENPWKFLGQQYDIYEFLGNHIGTCGKSYRTLSPMILG